MVTSSKTQTSAARLGSDAISSWGENPLFHVTRLCLSFLQGLFKQAPEGSFRWNQDRQITELVVTDELPLHSEQINKRPAIITVRSPVQWQGIAMEQRVSESARTGERVHTDLITGHMTFNCLSRVKVEAEQLGWLVSRHLWILQRLFMKAGFHKIGQRVQILSATPAGALVSGDTEGEIHNVAVVSPYEFQWTERITPLNLDMLNEVGISMGGLVREREPEEVRLTPGAIASGRIRPPYIRGRPISQEARRDAIPSAQPAGFDINIVVENDE